MYSCICELVYSWCKSRLYVAWYNMEKQYIAPSAEWLITSEEEILKLSGELDAEKPGSASEFDFEEIFGI